MEDDSYELLPTLKFAQSRDHVKRHYCIILAIEGKAQCTELAVVSNSEKPPAVVRNFQNATFLGHSSSCVSIAATTSSVRVASLPPTGLQTSVVLTESQQHQLPLFLGDNFSYAPVSKIVFHHPLVCLMLCGIQRDKRGVCPILSPIPEQG